MAGGGDLLALGHGLAAVITHGVAGVAWFLAGGVLLVDYLGMHMVRVVNRNGLSLHLSAALTLALALHFTLFLAGSLLGHVPVAKVVAQSRNFHLFHHAGMVQVIAGHAAVFLVSAGKLALARGGAGRFNDHVHFLAVFHFAQVGAVGDFGHGSVRFHIVNGHLCVIFEQFLHLLIGRFHIAPVPIRIFHMDKRQGANLPFLCIFQNEFDLSAKVQGRTAIAANDTKARRMTSC